MYCTGCGQEIDASDKFCSNCGKAISKNTASKIANGSTFPAADTMPSAKTTRKRLLPAWGYILIYIAVALAIIGCLAGVVIPELAGKRPTGGYFGYLMALAFWIGVATAIRGMQTGKSVWLWFLMGFLGIGFIAFFLIGFIMPFLAR